MTDHVPTPPAAAARRAGKRWTTPTLARLDSRDAENGPNPVAADGAFTPS